MQVLLVDIGQAALFKRMDALQQLTQMSADPLMCPADQHFKVVIHGTRPNDGKARKFVHNAFPSVMLLD